MTHIQSRKTKLFFKNFENCSINYPSTCTSKVLQRLSCTIWRLSSEVEQPPRNAPQKVCFFQRKEIHQLSPQIITLEYTSNLLKALCSSGHINYTYNTKFKLDSSTTPNVKTPSANSPTLLWLWHILQFENFLSS